MNTPPVRYANSGDASIAYQVLGEGPVDLVAVGGPASHLDIEWENPTAARVYRRLASFTRLIRFDRRGTGLSDPVERPLTLEQQMEDLLAVMEAVGSERTAISAGTDTGLGAMFAATHPDRVTSLMLYGVVPRASDMISQERAAVFLEALENYGQGSFMKLYAPSRVGDPVFEDWWARFERAAASPSTARKLLQLNLQMDISDVLPTIRVPTLVTHREGDALVPIEAGRELASRIPNARFAVVPGVDNYAWCGDWEREVEPILDLTEEFLTGSRRQREPDRVLATVLFTDIVGSTKHAARLGDSDWRELLGRHDETVRDQLTRWRGREVKSVGDGFLATFDGPARAVRCADAIVEAIEPLGIEVRAGLHTGECERMGDDVGGIAVHIGARVAALADGGQVLVSSTVKDLVVGSGLEFADRGPQELKGVPGEWRLFCLESSRAAQSSRALASSVR
ncbi:MAG: alpha/beta fold hydrolase [Thermoleophilaceae bacterium]